MSDYFLTIIFYNKNSFVNVWTDFSTSISLSEIYIWLDFFSSIKIIFNFIEAENKAIDELVANTYPAEANDRAWFNFNLTLIYFQITKWKNFRKHRKGERTRWGTNCPKTGGRTRASWRRRWARGARVCFRFGVCPRGIGSGQRVTQKVDPKEGR